jgi:hypothetical protein
MGRRYFGGVAGDDTSWSESANRRASVDDVTLDELSVSSDLEKKVFRSRFVMACSTSWLYSWHDNSKNEERRDEIKREM